MWGQGGGKTRKQKIGFLVTEIWKMLISPIQVQDELGESGSKMSLEIAFFNFLGKLQRKMTAIRMEQQVCHARDAL